MATCYLSTCSREHFRSSISERMSAPGLRSCSISTRSMERYTSPHLSSSRHSPFSRRVHLGGAVLPLITARCASRCAFPSWPHKVHLGGVLLPACTCRSLADRTVRAGLLCTSSGTSMAHAPSEDAGRLAVEQPFGWWKSWLSKHWTDIAFILCAGDFIWTNCRSSFSLENVSYSSPGCF